MSDMDRKIVPTVNSDGTVADKPEPVKAFAVIRGGEKINLRNIYSSKNYADNMAGGLSDISQSAEYRVIPVRIVPEVE